MKGTGCSFASIHTSIISLALSINRPKECHWLSCVLFRFSVAVLCQALETTEVTQIIVSPSSDKTVLSGFDVSEAGRDLVTQYPTQTATNYSGRRFKLLNKCQIRIEEKCPNDVYAIFSFSTCCENDWMSFILAGCFPL